MTLAPPPVPCRASTPTTLLPLQSTGAAGRSRSTLGDSHPLGGFLRSTLAGMLHPAPDLGFTALHAVRAATFVVGRTAAIPAMHYPSEELPSRTSAPCHQGRFLRVVRLLSGGPSENRAMSSSRVTRLSPLTSPPVSGLPCAMPLSQRSKTSEETPEPRLRGITPFESPYREAPFPELSRPVHSMGSTSRAAKLG